MRIVALDTYDNVQEGTEYECPDHQAAKLIAKGLAKLTEPLSDRRAPESLNQGNPSAADGQGRLSSASQAAPASPEKTAQPYPGGGLVTPDSRIIELERKEFEESQIVQTNPQNSDPATPQNQQREPAQNSQPGQPESSDPPAPRRRGRPPGSKNKAQGE